MTNPRSLDDLDKTDRLIVAALQINGRASWTAIARLLDTSVTTVTRRAQRLIAEGLVRVVAVHQPTGGRPADRFIVRFECTPGTEVNVARALAALVQVRFCVLVAGAFDVVAEFVVPKGTGLPALLVGGLQDVQGVQRRVADLELHTYKSTHDWSAGLLPGGDQLAVSRPFHDCEPGHLDPLDERIIAELREDGRASFQSAASVLDDVSESTVRRRFETLHDAGCVQVVTLVPSAALGFESEILLWVTVTPARLEDVAHALAALRSVRFVAVTVGQQSLLCEVILPTHQDLHHFVADTLANIDGIQAWTANVELLTLKRAYVHTPWASQHLSGATPPLGELTSPGPWETAT